ncbi:hypothetical protein RB195_014730 [Necator americanus]|uniref:SCP domain-containing protein n=1 Tax=Necator americanus TaxID=51031 RepID=A0ABR1E2N3_NECAM
MQRYIVILTVLFGGSAATDYQCWNFQSTDEIRHRYITTINNYRSQIALGTAPNKNGTCPRGQNVYKLSWDCFLEMQAQNAADQCSENVKGPTGYSQLVQKVRITTCNLAPIPKSTVDGWWSEVKSVGVNSNNPVNAENLQSFATLANGKATKIGCAQRNCGADLYVVCVVYDSQPALNTPIYEVGEGCTSTKDCTTFAKSKCNVGTSLCLAGYIDTTATNTTTTTTATTITTTSASQTDNTICPNNQVISDTLRNVFLKRHNQIRTRVAQGSFALKDGKYARRASKMIELKYNCDAESSANDWAKQCKDSDSYSNKYDEIRYVYKGTNTDLEAITRSAINVWRKEAETGSFLQGPNDKNVYQSALGIPNLAKIVWDDHKELGCAVVKCSDFTNVVCHYTPKVFTTGGQIYKMGEPCKRCSAVGQAVCKDNLCALN